AGRQLPGRRLAGGRWRSARRRRDRPAGSGNYLGLSVHSTNDVRVRHRRRGHHFEGWIPGGLYRGDERVRDAAARPVNDKRTGRGEVPSTRPSGLGVGRLTDGRGTAPPTRYSPAGTRGSVPDPCTSRFSTVTASATRSGPMRNVTPLGPAAISPSGW